MLPEIYHKKAPEKVQLDLKKAQFIKFFQHKKHFYLLRSTHNMAQPYYFLQLGFITQIDYIMIYDKLHLLIYRPIKQKTKSILLLFE